MVWRACVAGMMALLASAAAYAQDAPPYSSVTQHELPLKDRTLAYTATVGLMPIRAKDDGKLIGDMSYTAYTMPARRGETRPVAFIWNGGSGANSTPLHYGAFGPKRLAGTSLKPNEATLLDVADLVFLDQIETGFGRYDSLALASAYLNQKSDAETFATFIEHWLKEHGGTDRPAYLIGESYGVRRAQLVAEDLLARDIAPEALILISGYVLVGKKLDPQADGVFRLAPYAALGVQRGKTKDTEWTAETQIHDAVADWALNLSQKLVEKDASARQDFVDGLQRFWGLAEDAISAPGLTLPIEPTGRSLTVLRSFLYNRVAEENGRNVYDIRRPSSDGREWISQAIVDDFRKSLNANPPGRAYVGQEYEAMRVIGLPIQLRGPMQVKRADGTVVELTQENAYKFPELRAAFDALVPGAQLGPPKTPDGLAHSVVNFSVHFQASLALPETRMPELMAAAPEMEIFHIGGMYDELVPCAVGEEMIRRDLADVASRVRSKCYVGGHMMYDAEPEALILADDVRSFIRAVEAGDRSLGAAVTP